MIATSKLTRKNQTTIPKAVLRVLGAKPADQLVYEIEENRVTLHAKTGRLADLAGRFASFGKHPRTPLPVEDMSDAVARAVADDYRRKQAPGKSRVSR